jgi:hypothetical protein
MNSLGFYKPHLCTAFQYGVVTARTTAYIAFWVLHNSNIHKTPKAAIHPVSPITNAQPTRWS